MKKFAAILIVLCLSVCALCSCARYDNAFIAVVSPQKTENLRYGEDVSAHFTESTFIYFDDFSIEKYQPQHELFWKNGRLFLRGISRPIYGIVTGADNIILDVYSEMKSALDNGERVLVILLDGFALWQAEESGQEMQTIKKSGFSRTTSVNPAISNVSLASILTGDDPKSTGITDRGVKKPNGSDIFEYAVGLNKTVSYIEGNSVLVLTSVQPVLTVPDKYGFTDEEVYNHAKAAISAGTDFVFTHFHGIDDANHAQQNIREKIAECDAFITDLIDGFSGKVIIVADHGHLKAGGHGYFTHEDMFVPLYSF